VFVPLKAPRRFLAAILSPSGKLEGLIDADPWVPDTPGVGKATASQ
jgi:hypothetical protein